jgi:transposase-like protein
MFKLGFLLRLFGGKGKPSQPTKPNCAHKTEVQVNIGCFQDGSGAAEYTCTNCGNKRSALVYSARSTEPKIIEH